MARRGRPRHPDILTPREWAVLELLRDGRTNDEIAVRLGISLSTAKFHVSEILGKLGLNSRDEAARWRPDGATGRPFTLLAPLAWLRPASAGLVARAAGVTIVLATVAAVATLAWGVISSRHGGAAGSTAGAPTLIAPPSPCPETQTGPLAVGLVDAGAHHCTSIPGSGLSLAQWVRDGQTFVAYDVSDPDHPAYKIYDLRGRPLDTIDFKVPEPFDGRLYAWVAPSPDGITILVTRNSGSGVHSLNARDVQNGEERAFPALPGLNDTVSYSPDGTHVSYVNHDGASASLVIARADGSDATPLRSARVAEGHVEALQWSPDGNYLLIMSGAVGAPCVGAAAQDCYQFATITWEVIDASGTLIWRSATAIAPAYGLTFSWLGPGRLLMRRPATAGADHVPPVEPQAVYISIPDGRESPADLHLIDVSNFSPDGKLGVLGCALYDVERHSIVPTTGCAHVYDWTADSKFGLNAGEGN